MEKSQVLLNHSQKSSYMTNSPKYWPLQYSAIMSSLHARRPPKLEQGDLLRRNKQRGAGGTLRRPPNNGITVLDIPSGGGVSSKKKKFCTPCRCISSFVVIFLALLFMRGRAVLDRAAWPLKSNIGGVGLRSSIHVAKLDEQPGWIYIGASIRGNNPNKWWCERQCTSYHWQLQPWYYVLHLYHLRKCIYSLNAFNQKDDTFRENNY